MDTVKARLTSPDGHFYTGLDAAAGALFVSSCRRKVEGPRPSSRFVSL
jgi:hypothetical protein